VDEAIVIAVFAAAVFTLIAVIPVFAVVEIIIAVVAEIVVMAITFCHLQFLPVSQINTAPLDGNRGKNMAASRIHLFHLKAPSFFSFRLFRRATTW
jgi:hypothetical protein